MTRAPLPEITALTEPYWVALADGRLTYQRCGRCGHSWLPAREECPDCLADAPAWVEACGRGRLVSWVVYHRAIHEWFVDKVPYTVAVVELDEGPRLISSLIPGGTPTIDAPLRFRPTVVDDFGVASFELAD
ncbi:OB-fold domain-containing protein [Nocardia sp. R6R-6]|uniref:OB-fold domain-containing protein n=1 Tax=Nocardia sp. R6R-6 TaxID=3459303 RepID=UPI00403DA1B7